MLGFASCPERDSAREVGDEALLIHRELGIPVCVCGDRQRALEELVAGVMSM